MESSQPHLLHTCRIAVSGKVQGVWFRKHTVQQAAERVITGTVENLPDGSVQIVATGTAEQLKELISWCHQGPPLAQVQKVEFREVPLQLFSTFRQIR
ncbi:MAG TPA: acylphosphatase [Lacibacter sp.]|nr:acylphosphatase [Lacibacter sp.]HMO87614.1 acylphosphatase [Lacibacter sp.]HMP86982.1 acylphosphatase [Lacibacter sp.]